MKAIVVAYDKNLGIGANNDLLWQRNLPADLLNFKKITDGHPVIMGRKTFESIGKALPNRRNIVISRSYNKVDGIEVVDSLQSAYSLAKNGEDMFIIGGQQIFEMSINNVDKIFVTEVNAIFKQATVFFPLIDPKIWAETKRIKHLADEKNLYNYDFITYERR
ncbi:MAG: dihydrofolate reductase [Patescibacteria group bacterium]|nr:dihydrofolate reductase [Patescibacteria group bacterium]